MDSRVHLAVDIMSGDFGPRVTLPAALAALSAHPSLHLHLVGNAPEIEAQLEQQDADARRRLSITHAPGVLAMDASPREALRGDQDSSLHSCFRLLADQRVAGVVSAGSTSALMALGRQRVSMLPGFGRPALCSSVPSESGISYMLDLGANVEADSQCLLEFGLLGSALARALDGLEAPRVALLSNGVEVSKGSTAMREAARRLEADQTINYVGYIEGSALYRGNADVIVCDGLLGNVALKTAEGTAHYAASQLARSFSRHWWLRLLARAASPALREIESTLSADLYGGAFLLGLNGVVVKSHGASSSTAFQAAVEQAARCIEQKMVPGLALHLDQDPAPGPGKHLDKHLDKHPEENLDNQETPSQ